MTAAPAGVVHPLRTSRRPRRAGGPGVALAVSALAACSQRFDAPARFPEDTEPGASYGSGIKASAETEFAVPPPPFSAGVFPCQACHQRLVANKTPHVVVAHPTIALDHGPRPGWCFDCHDPQDRDVLHLTGGEPVPFSESYRLCGQCHGEHLRDWRVGIHGRRTGSWNGHKQYLLCAHCHDPHRPHFQPIEPLPPPRRPEPATGGSS